MPQPQKIQDRLQFVDDALARLRAERSRLVARASVAERKRDTRKKILIGGAVPIVADKSCKVVYVILPRFLSISDAIRLRFQGGEEPSAEARPVVFVLQDTSPQAATIISERFPTCKIVRVTSH